MASAPERAQRRLAFRLLVASAILILLALGLAFTVYGEIAGFLGVVALVWALVLFVHARRERTSAIS